jgi:hypothetical protein
LKLLDSRFRGNDESKQYQEYCELLKPDEPRKTEIIFPVLAALDSTIQGQASAGIQIHIISECRIKPCVADIGVFLKGSNLINNLCKLHNDY